MTLGGMNKLATIAVAKATGKRWCTHHQGEVSTLMGSMVVKRRGTRWVCFECQRKAGLIK